MKRNLNQAPARHVSGLIVAAAIAAVLAGCGGKPRDFRAAALAQAVASTPVRSTPLPAPQPGYFGDEFRDVESRLSNEPVEDLAPTF